MRRTVFSFWLVLIMLPAFVYGGAFHSNGQAIAVPFVAFIAHTFFRNAPVDLSPVWQEPLQQKQLVKNRTLCPGYFAVITCPPKKDTSKKEEQAKENTGSNSPPPSSPPPDGTGVSEACGSASTGAGGQAPDDNDPNKRKFPAWAYEDDEEIDEDVICNICKERPATHSAVGCCKKKICNTCIERASRENCAFCGKCRRPVYRCQICRNFEKTNLEDMHGHMEGHVRSQCGGRRLVYRANQGHPTETFYGTMSEIIQQINEMLYVSCPFPDCDFMDTMAEFQFHMEHEHESQACPSEGCQHTCDYQHILVHLPDFTFSFEQETFNGPYSELVQLLEQQVEWLYCQVCVPVDNLPQEYDAVVAVLCAMNLQISSGQACYDHCMNAHASLHCSRCPVQFNCLEIHHAQVHANSHALYLPIGEEAVPQQVPLAAARIQLLICPYCDASIDGNEDDLVRHMSACFEADQH